jgi:hypothetical protein
MGSQKQSKIRDEFPMFGFIAGLGKRFVENVLFMILGVEPSAKKR